MWYLWKNWNWVVSAMQYKKDCMQQIYFALLSEKKAKQKNMYWLWCIDFDYTGSVAFVACTDHHPVAACLSAWKYSIAWSLPLPLMACLCDSQPLHSIVLVPWHLGGGMMQRQPWWWSQLWCNAVMQQQGYFRSTSEPPRPASASMPPCPSLSQHLICHKSDSHTWTGIHRIY